MNTVTKEATYVESLSPLLPRYDALLIDICGVLHDGKLVFPWTNQTLAQLNDIGKRLVLFSNSPRTTTAATKQLQKYGVEIAGAELCTSGEYFLDQMRRRILEDKANANMMILGEDKNPELTQSLVEGGARIVSKATEAKYMVILDNAASEDEFGRHDQAFAAGLQAGVIALCPNPDTKATAGRGIMYPQGAFANRYRQMGGQVEYFGKPMFGFYRYAEEKYDLAGLQVLAIGDNMDTDIEGAENYGLDSLLIIGTGIYRDIDALHSGMLNKYDFRPTYATEKFCL